jgi:ubiquitin-protein ligase E3 C
MCVVALLNTACLTDHSEINRRRDQLLEDSFSQLNAMGPERLKGRLRIAYVNEAGLAEAGIDGGGLFKDFMEELLRQGFSPQVGLRVC